MRHFCTAALSECSPVILVDIGIAEEQDISVALAHIDIEDIAMQF